MGNASHSGDGPLPGYRRHKKRLISPLNQHIASTDVPWLERSLPEFLWFTGDFVGDNAHALIAALDALQAFAPLPAPGGRVVDGTISNFAIVPGEARPAARVAWQRAAPWGSPLVFRHALSFFPHCPAAWLFDPVEPPNEEDRQAALNVIRRAIVLYSDGRASESTALRAAVLMRRTQLGVVSGMERALSSTDYDGAPGAMIRSAWTAGLAAEDLRPTVPTPGEWSRHFWAVARTLSPCDLGDVETPAFGLAHDARSELPAAEYRAVREAAHRVGADLRRAQSALVQDSPVESKDETVLLAMASRTFRLMLLLLQQPGLWNNGTSSFLMRPIVEARIAITWLASKGDAKAFEEYREHGRGNALMLRARIEEDAASEGIELDPATKGIMDRLDRKNGAERTWLAQDVNLGSWGPTVRNMAKQVGLEDVYGLSFAASSASVHGEWPTVRDMDSELCVEPLHGHHCLGSFEPTGQAVEPHVPLVALSHVADACDAAFVGCGYDSVIELFRPLESSLRALASATPEAGAGSNTRPRRMAVTASIAVAAVALSTAAVLLT